MKKHLIGLVLIVLCATTAQAIVPDAAWEFNTQDPNVDWPGTVKGSMGYRDDLVGPGGLNGDGTATFSDNGTTGWPSFSTPQFAGAYTVDLRVKAVVESEVKIGQISYNNNGVNRGRGLNFFTPTGGTGNAITITTTSNVWQGFWHWGTLTDSGVDTGGYHRVRMVVTADGTNVRVTMYDLEKDLDPGPGYNWAIVQATNRTTNVVTNYFPLTGNTGAYGAFGTFGLGSNMYTGNTYGQIGVDFARFKNGAFGATDPIMTPEPATLMLLVLGALPMLRRRVR